MKSRMEREKGFGVLRMAVLVLGCFALIVFCAYHYFYLVGFNSMIQTNFVEQDLDFFSYYVKVGSEDFVLVVGDLNGLNRRAYESVDDLSWNNSFGKEDSVLLLPTIFPEKAKDFPEMLDEKLFMERVSSRERVVVVDNFCSKEWGELMEKAIYESGEYSSGAFCFSDVYASLVNSILMEYDAQKVYLIYDQESYRDFVHNFVLYLKEREIDYEFVFVENVEDVYEN